LLLIILNAGYVFQDKLPDLKKLKAYSPEKIEYGKTTVKKFKKNFPKINNHDIEVYAGGITIIKMKPPITDTYSLIRAAFKNDRLDWIEFTLVHNIKISKFISLYGSPTNVDTEYNKILDYYNYDFFNISADKIDKNAKTITYFNKSPLPLTEINPKKLDVPFNQKKKFFEKFKNIEPGVTLECDFTSEFPGLIPYFDNKSETTSIYVMSDELVEASYYYDKAVLKFENGLLTWINLIPKSLPLNECLKTIKKPYKKERVDSFYELYDFSTFILVVDKKTKMVKSIGLFNKDVLL
jgi:hypothetical protein